MITRNLNKISKPCSISPAATLVLDTIEHHSLTQVEACKALNISSPALNYIIKGKRSLNADFALRFELAFKVPASLLLRLQSSHDYAVAYYKNIDTLKKEVRQIA